MYETIEWGKPQTAFLKFGDTVRIEMFDAAGASIFGAIPGNASRSTRVRDRPPASPSFGLAALLTTLVALGPLSTDLYLPSLPTLVEVFATDAARVQLTLSVFLAGFAVAQLAYGALSDRYGRRPVMLGIGPTCWRRSPASSPPVSRCSSAPAFCRPSGPAPGRCWAGPSSATSGDRPTPCVLAYVSGAMAVAPGRADPGRLSLRCSSAGRPFFAVLVLFSALQVSAVWLWLGESTHPTRRHPAGPHPGEFRHPSPTATTSATCFAWLFLQRPVCLHFRLGLRPDRPLLASGPRFTACASAWWWRGYIAGTTISGARPLRRRPLVFVGGWVGALAGLAMWASTWPASGP